MWGFSRRENPILYCPPPCLLPPPMLPASPLSHDAAVPSMDPVAAQRWMAQHPAVSPWLHEEVGRRMVERLGWIRQVPAAWMDWHPALGGWAACHAVARQYADSEVFLPSALSMKAFDAAKVDNSGVAGWWKRLTRRGPQVPGADTRVDLVWANMLLHGSAQPQAMMAAWWARLQTHGWLMFSCLGPDSLRELRDVYRQQGWGEACHAFTDMHDWGDMLVATGFAEPVMDVERMVLTYSSAERLLDDLRGLGRNLSARRLTVTRGRAWRQHLLDTLERDMPRDADGRLQLTFEVIYGHAHRPEPRPKVAAQTAVSLQDMRQMLGSTRKPSDSRDA